MKIKKKNPMIHTLHDGIDVGISLHMKDDMEPSKFKKTAHKPNYLCTIDVVLESMIEIVP